MWFVCLNLLHDAAQIVSLLYCLCIGRVNRTDAGHPKEPFQDFPDVTGRQS